MSETSIQLEELLCDFCGQTDTCWVYPIDDFSQELDPAQPNSHELHMLGGWNACQPCYELIETEDREQLVDRSLSEFGLPETSKVYDAVRTRVQRVHDEFFFSRNGEAVRESEYEDEPGYEPGVIRIETSD